MTARGDLVLVLLAIGTFTPCCCLLILISSGTCAGLCLRQPWTDFQSPLEACHWHVRRCLISMFHSSVRMHVSHGRSSMLL